MTNDASLAGARGQGISGRNSPDRRQVTGMKDLSLWPGYGPLGQIGQRNCSGVSRISSAGSLSPRLVDALPALRGAGAACRDYQSGNRAIGTAPDRAWRRSCGTAAKRAPRPGPDPMPRISQMKSHAPGPVIKKDQHGGRWQSNR